jgi:hypothetical protein
MHLLRFVMMVDVLSPDEVLGFLASLRTALAGFVTDLERASASPDVGGNLASQCTGPAWTGLGRRSPC